MRRTSTSSFEYGHNNALPETMVQVHGAAENRSTLAPEDWLDFVHGHQNGECGYSS
jgi:hypothetical protein